MKNLLFARRIHIDRFYAPRIYMAAQTFLVSAEAGNPTLIRLHQFRVEVAGYERHGHLGIGGELVRDMKPFVEFESAGVA